MIAFLLLKRFLLLELVGYRQASFYACLANLGDAVVTMDLVAGAWRFFGKTLRSWYHRALERG